MNFRILRGTFLLILLLGIMATVAASSLTNVFTSKPSKVLVYPESLLMLDDKIAHHILIAEKSTHQLHLFSNRNGYPRYVKSYQAATGKRMGNKFVKGDKKTPEGVYTLQRFIPSQELVERYGKEGEIYGAGAFVMSYPNPIDRRQGKTGGGIWLHSTNDNSRVDKGLDSRGCVVVIDDDLKDLSRFIELEKTSIIVVQDLKLLSEKTWTENRNSILNTIENWSQAWAAEDFSTYISHYHPQEFKDPRKGNYFAFRSYKRAVFAGPGKPIVKVKDLSILRYKDYVVASFIQDYASNTITDIGRKTLYLKRDQNYEWKIVTELWSKYHEDRPESVAFTPSMRFFTNDSANTN